MIVPKFERFACVTSELNVVSPERTVVVPVGVAASTTVPRVLFPERFNLYAFLTSVVLPTSITRIEYYAFENTNLKNIFDLGETVQQYNQIYISCYSDDEYFLSKKYMYSEEQPEKAGEYWHFVDDVPTIWEVNQ